MGGTLSFFFRPAPITALIAKEAFWLCSIMSLSVAGKLDLVSRVTIHVFAAETLFAALLAVAGPKAFGPTFAMLLLFFAVLQTMGALGARRRAPSSSLTEWDGISWLLLMAAGTYVFAW